MVDSGWSGGRGVGALLKDGTVMRLVVSTAVRDLGLGAVVIFWPVYVYKIGGMGAVVGYLVVARTIQMLWGYFAAGIASRVGWGRSMALSAMIHSLGLIALSYYGRYSFALWVGAVLSPIAVELYWLPYHFVVADSRTKQLGRELGILGIVARWSVLLGPVVGGLWIVERGFGELFGWGVVMILVSAVVSWKIDNARMEWKVGWWEFWKGVWAKDFRRDLVAHIGWGIEECMYDVIWPVFLWRVMEGSYLVLGGFKSVVLLVTSVLLWWVGKQVDGRRDRRRLGMMTLVLMVFWVIRGAVSNKWGLGVWEIVDGWVGVGVFLPFAVYVMRRAREVGEYKYLVTRAAVVNMGRLVAAVGVGVAYMVGWGWEKMVWLGVVGLGMMRLVPRKGKE